MSNKDENEGNFDLSGVFHVQSDYLTDLSNNTTYPDVNNAPLIASRVLDLQNKLKETKQTYNSANTSADNVLTEQQKIIDIVEQEQKRLDDKKFLIDQAESEERRKVLLSESHRLRKAEYTKIILIFIICVVIHVVLLLLSKHLFEQPIDPGMNTFFILMHLFNFALWTIIALYIYVNIQSRSQINFNKLELPPPNILGTSSTPAIQDYNNILKDLGFCYSDGCCGENTVFNKEMGTCEGEKTVSNSPQESSTPDRDQEGFTPFTESPLNTMPTFIPGTNSEGQPTESTFGVPTIPPPEEEKDTSEDFNIRTASSEEVKDKTKRKVKRQMREMYDKHSLDPNELFNELDEFSNNSMNMGLEQGEQSKGEIEGVAQDMLDQHGGASSVKCYFTTIDGAKDELEGAPCKQTNRMFYKPTNNNDLLPQSDTLDHSIFYRGMNSNEKITNKFSVYN